MARNQFIVPMGERRVFANPQTDLPKAVDILGMKRFRRICLMAVTGETPAIAVTPGTDAEKSVKENRHVQASGLIDLTHQGPGS
ncbi:MAG TPA: hypothetical protein DHV36_17650 [Desulfobacteraceae bacterium]|nr:hypothetical protein [Desulfobacteraceae bacterium]